MIISTIDNINIFVDEPYNENDFLTEFNKPIMLKYTSLSYPIKKETLLDKKLYVKDGEKRFIFKINDKIIGSADIYNLEEHKATLRYWIAQDFWGKGIGTKTIKEIIKYCFENLKLSRLDAYVFEENIGSKKVLEKLGFTCEGLLKNYDKKDGKLINEYIYAIYN